MVENTQRKHNKISQFVRYGSGSTKIMWLLAAPVPALQHCFKQIYKLFVRAFGYNQQPSNHGIVEQIYSEHNLWAKYAILLSRFYSVNEQNN
jgi:hypothetical protein